MTDAGQATHFQVIESCGRRANLIQEQHRIDHVGYGVVLGEDKKKFKTRSGDTVKLSDLLDEGTRKRFLLSFFFFQRKSYTFKTNLSLYCFATTC